MSHGITVVDRYTLKDRDITIQECGQVAVVEQRLHTDKRWEVVWNHNEFGVVACMSLKRRFYQAEHAMKTRGTVEAMLYGFQFDGRGKLRLGLNSSPRTPFMALGYCHREESYYAVTEGEVYSRSSLYRADQRVRQLLIEVFGREIAVEPDIEFEDVDKQIKFGVYRREIGGVPILGSVLYGGQTGGIFHGNMLEFTTLSSADDVANYLKQSTALANISLIAFLHNGSSQSSGGESQ